MKPAVLIRTTALYIVFQLAIITPSVAIAADLRVAAAASLTYAMEAIAEQYQQQSEDRLLLTFGSSRTLMRQIIQGAPFELFLSADEASVRTLIEQSLVDGESVIYARGRLVLFAPNHSKIVIENGLRGLTDAIGRGELQRLAMANPATAPYGNAAAEALRSAALWSPLKKRLVLGENAMQAAQFGLTGAVDAALIPYSLALRPVFQQRGRYQLIDDKYYQPLDQQMVLLRRTAGGSKTAPTSAARNFFQFIQSKPAKATLARYGLSVMPVKRESF